eukprot:11187147-Lingulodinium_polyedra.AAC.1
MENLVRTVRSIVDQKLSIVFQEPDPAVLARNEAILYAYEAADSSSSDRLANADGDDAARRSSRARAMRKLLKVVIA